MLGRSAVRTTRKVMEKCPRCGDKTPKELVEGEKKMRWGTFAWVVPCTLGLALFWPPLWYNSRLEAYCPECAEPFPV